MRSILAADMLLLCRPTSNPQVSILTQSSRWQKKGRCKTCTRSASCKRISMPASSRRQSAIAGWLMFISLWLTNLKPHNNNIILSKTRSHSHRLRWEGNRTRSLQVSTHGLITRASTDQQRSSTRKQSTMQCTTRCITARATAHSKFGITSHISAVASSTMLILSTGRRRCTGIVGAATPFQAYFWDFPWQGMPQSVASL